MGTSGSRLCALDDNPHVATHLLRADAALDDGEVLYGDALGARVDAHLEGDVHSSMTARQHDMA